MINGKLLITGARERKGGFELGDGKYYEKGVLAELDLETGTYREVYSLSEGGQNYPKEHPNLQFTAGCTSGDRLWLPTDTEIHELKLPSYEPVRIISHPCFQNLHSIHAIGDQLIATSTGLDNIIFLNANTGAIEKIVNAEGKAPWHRFKEDTDYRQVHSTRPHDCHPNYVFQMRDSLWITRCRQEDAVNILDFSDRIDITRGDESSVHDGVIWNDKLVFTRVDALLPIFDSASGEFVRLEDPFRGHTNKPIGWCRGLLIDGDIAYLGFSRIRKTRMKDRLKFLAKRNIKYNMGSCALVAAYDMKNHKLLRIYHTPEGMIDAVYGVIKPTIAL